jgi:phospholipid/cholesterol/gamma-HCH transport system substrate-binding protein
METRANYVMIGLFTLGVILAGFLFVFWAAGRDTRALTSYRILFTGSVSGLARGSSVFYNGIKIGEVTTISLLPADPGKVVAFVTIDAKTPVNEDTKARLEFQGLTGVAAIQMTGGNPQSKRLIVEDLANPPMITAERSELQDLLESARRLSARADDVLGHAEKLFSDNEGAVSETMRNIETFSRSLAAYPDSLSRILNSTASATESIADVSVKAGDLVDRLNKAAGRLDNVLAGAETIVGSDEVRGSLVEFGDAARAVKELARNLDGRTSQIAQNVDAVANDSRKSLAELERTLREFRMNPQQIITGSKPPVPAYATH